MAKKTRGMREVLPFWLEEARNMVCEYGEKSEVDFSPPKYIVL